MELKFTRAAKTTIKIRCIVKLKFWREEIKDRISENCVQFKTKQKLPACSFQCDNFSIMLPSQLVQNWLWPKF